MSKRRKIPARRSPPASDGADYSAWLAQVPLDKREVISKFLRTNPVKDYEDVLTFSQFLLAELVEGNITPVIAREARNYLELIFTIIATKNSAMGTPGNAYMDIIGALIAVKQEAPRLTASYTTDAEIIDVEPEKIEETG
tara:strand:- start:661 stop:1080 length:420 start_codon:yes stop_codon:yes gene_type:complete